MPKSIKEQTTKPKLSKDVYLTQYLGKKIDAKLSHYDTEQKIELAEHLLKTFDDLFDYFKTKDDNVYQKYANRENQLLKKYGKKFKPFSELSLYKFFDFDNVLSEADYYTSKEFNSLTDADRAISEGNIKELVSTMKRRLHGMVYYLYLEREPQFETKEKEVNVTGDEVDKEITEARQLLALYYLLKSGFDIEHRGTNAVSETARFAHLMTGTKFTTLQKSSIYKKYQLIPNYNKEEYLIKDLRFIRPYFEALHIQKALDLIDNEIETSIKELPLSKRKQYQ